MNDKANRKPNNDDNPGSEDMNADELAMFNKIMGEIDGQEQPDNQDEGEQGTEPKKVAGDAESTSQNTDDADGDGLDEDQQKALESIMAQIEGENKSEDTSENGSPTDNEDEDDFAAELEKVAREAESVSQDDAADQNTDDADDDELDEDQQKALESIMAQIEGENKSEDTSENSSPTAETETANADDEDEDDFAAELEKVAREAETASQDDAADPNTDDADDDELDEDQQKAFESIMAQIEGGNKSDDTSENSGPTAETETGNADEDEDDFAAELEKVAREAESASQDDAADQSTDEADDDALDEDQQKAFESIMAEIEGKSTEKKSSDVNPVPSAESDKKEILSSKKDVEKDQEDDDDVDTDDISDDIEDILKEITSDLDESDDGKKIDEQTTAHDLEIVNNDDISDNDQPDEKTSERLLSDTEAPVEKTATEKVADPEKESSEVKTARTKANTKKSPLPEKVSFPQKVKNSIRIGRKTVISGFVLLIISFSLAGYYYYIKNSSEIETISPAPVVEKVAQQEQAVATEVVQPVPVNDDSSDLYRLKMIGDDIDQLRADLIAKRKEIEELQEYYQTGVDAEIQNVVKTLEEAGRGRPITLNTAMADPLVSLGIKAIQRRDSYINKLKDPANTLYLNSEELLYLSRKVALLMIMAGKTSDIDIDGFIDQANSMMTAHRNALAKLNIDDVDVPKPNLDKIWKRIESRLKTANASSATRSTQQTENEAIWAALCSGNFSRKHKLTELSPDAARCLASWKGKDLFLNELRTLSPPVARQLAEWKGQWLGLNGLSDLSPEAAGYLAKWKGKGLSLNGLTRLSPRVVAILSEWQGDQIELINVKHMAHWENPKTRLFLSEEMGRKINSKRQ